MNVNKCLIMAPQFTSVGYKIDAKGLHPLPDKVRAVENAPRPNNTTKLKVYLSLFTYYGRFFPNLSKVLSPLYRLLRKGVRWV